MSQTVTVVAAVRAGESYPAPFSPAHFEALHRLAEWTCLEVPVGCGFTLAPSVGGGAGWALEAGATFTFAGVEAAQEPRLRAWAERLRSHLGEQAVVFCTRGESFVLQEQPAAVAAA